MEVSNIEFNFTGFGAFGNIIKNPTQQIMEQIRDFLEQSNIQVGYTKVLKVAAEDVEAELLGLYNALEIRSMENSNVKQVLIHTGVCAGGQAVQLENMAVNCSDFRIPDARQWQPKSQVINKNFSLEHKMLCQFPINEFVNTLSQNHKVIYSDNAGLYICNYCYYISLLEGIPRNIPSLFIHVPLFEVINMQQQLEIFRDVCLEIKRFYKIEC